MRTERDVRELLARWQQLWAEHGLGPWIFRLRKDGAFLGYAGLAPAAAVEPGAFELLYAIRPERWSQGWATRTARLALDDVRSGSAAGRIVGFTWVENRASRRVLEKLGFRFEREFVRAGLPHVLYRMRSKLDR